MTECSHAAASPAAESFDDAIRRSLKAQLDGIRFDAEEKERIAQGVRSAVALAHAPTPGAAARANGLPARAAGAMTQAANATASPAGASIRPATRKRRPAFRFAIAAAAAVAAMGLGTVAYASGALVTVGDAVATLFGAGPAPTEVVDKVGRPIGAAQSVNGVTVSADAIFADEQNCSIVYSVRKDDGTPFEGLVPNEYGFLNVTNTGQNTEIVGTFDLAQLFDGDRNGILGAYGSSYFYDADPADPAIQMVEQMSLTGEHESIIGKTAHARFGDFFAISGDDYENPVDIASGRWDLAFVIDCEDASVAMPAGRPFRVASGEATMGSLTLSPIAVSMKYALVPDGNAGPGDGRDFGEASGAGDLTLLMADGSELDVTNPGGIGMAPRDDGAIVCDQSVFLPQIVDPDEVVGIAIGGTVFPTR